MLADTDRSPRRTLLADDGQGKPEGGSPPRRALYPYFSLVLVDEHLADIQAQTKPFPRTTLDGDAFHLVKTLPDLLLRFCREARSPVTHPDTGHLSLDRHPDAHRLVRRRIAQRIGHVVGEHLADAIPISQHKDPVLLW